MNHSKSKNPWIAGLSSFAIHLTLLLLMAIWTVASSGGSRNLSIDSGLATNDSELETVLVESKSQNDSNQSGFQLQEISSSILAIDAKPEISTMSSGPSSKVETLSDSDLIRMSSSVSKSTGTSFVSSSLEGRSAKNRGSVGTLNGATPASEAAVEAALAYLARHQRNNGSWTVRFEDGPCQGECDHGGFEKDPHEIAATGLALLCFLGAGHTMREGEYSDHVQRGVYFLIQNLRESQSGRRFWLTGKAEMYEHGIATLALCEALQMRGDEELLTKPCQETINQIIYAQHDGGWGYHPKEAGDLSIVGWQVLALKSAVSAKLVVNAHTIQGVDQFLKRHVRNDFLFVYNFGDKPSASMTAIGTLMRIFRGWSKTDPSILKAIEYLSKEGPSRGDFYYNYYATQVLFQYGGKPWTDWNSKMRDYLISIQETEGHMAGSWWLPGEPGKSSSLIANKTGGRLYATAMACLTLEVYYRYLPVNQAVTDDFQF